LLSAQADHAFQLSPTSYGWKFSLRNIPQLSGWGSGWGRSVPEMSLGALLSETLLMIPHGAAEGDDIGEGLVNQLMVHRLVQVQEALE